MSVPAHTRFALSTAIQRIAPFVLVWALAIHPASANESTNALSSEQLATFKDWKSSAKPDFTNNGLSEAFTDRIIKTIKPDAGALHRAQKTIKTRAKMSEFIDAATTEQRIARGRKGLTSPTLAQIEKSYSIPRAALLAIANAREANTQHNILDALATLAALDGRRSEIWQRELIAALRIAEARKIPLKLIRGTSTGNSGATHILPTFLEAFDADRTVDASDKRNQWHATNHEAFATTANALNSLGWRNLPAGVSWWGYEVRLPTNLDFSDVGLSYDHVGTVWQSRGVRRITSGLIPPDTRFSLITPQGARGPAFLVTHNVRVLRRLHDATSIAPDSTTYALAIARLSHRIMGGAPLTTPWRAVKSLTRSERMRLQEQLVARGYDTGGIDGILGRKSAIAIRAEQRKRGVPQDGFVDYAVIRMLQHSGLPHVGETE